MGVRTSLAPVTRAPTTKVALRARRDLDDRDFGRRHRERLRPLARGEEWRDQQRGAREANVYSDHTANSFPLGSVKMKGVPLVRSPEYNPKIVLTSLVHR